METAPTRKTEMKALDVEYRARRRAIKEARAAEDAAFFEAHKASVAELEQRYSYDSYILNLRTTQYEERVAARIEAEAKAAAAAEKL